MRKIPKMKKMTLSEMEDNFQVVGKQEQRMYVGGRTYTLNPINGQLNIVPGTEHITHQNVITSLCGNSITLPFGSVGSIQGNGTSFTNTNRGIEAFIFLATYSNVEWGMAIQHNGNVRLFTNNNRDRIDMWACPHGGTKKWVHSHPDVRDLSPEDYDMADAHRHKYHALFYNGQFRSFDSAGFFGGWRDTVW